MAATNSRPCVWTITFPRDFSEDLYCNLVRTCLSVLLLDSSWRPSFPSARVQCAGKACPLCLQSAPTSFSPLPLLPLWSEPHSPWPGEQLQAAPLVVCPHCTPRVTVRSCPHGPESSNESSSRSQCKPESSRWPPKPGRTHFLEPLLPPLQVPMSDPSATGLFLKYLGVLQSEGLCLAVSSLSNALSPTTPYIHS